ncbi:Ig-like domain-containing protein [Yersinia enterocolitica]|nr:Ig-like domain-containing protein [Yersinia enterocolitica]
MTSNVTVIPGPLDATRSTLEVSKPSINADDRTGSTITFTAQDAQGNAITGLDIEFISDLEDSLITAIVDHNDGRYTGSINGTKAGIANITVMSSGLAISGVSAAVTITFGSWDPAQSSPIMELSQPTNSCILAGGGYQRAYVTINPLPLYDNYGNTITGQLTYKVGAASVTSVTGATSNIGVGAISQMNTGASVTWREVSPSYATEALCLANRIVSTNVTVNVSGITDGFSTITVNKNFILGTGN